MQCASCKNKRSLINENNISFFHFPNNKQLREKWLQFCGRSDPLSKYWRVCEYHFRNEELIGKVQRDLGIPRRLSLTEGAVPSIVINDENKILDHKGEGDHYYGNVASCSSASNFLVTSQESQPKKQKISDDDMLLQMTRAKLNGGKETTEGDIISKSWGSQYDQMEVSQQIIARKIISDVLFHGCVGSLQMEHVVQVQNIFDGQNPPASDYVPQHQLMIPIHHILNGTSNTLTPTPTLLRSTTPFHSAQPQSTFLAYELSEESLISSPTMSTQRIDPVEDFDLSKIKNELDIEEQ